MRWAMNQITLHGGSRRPPDDLPRDLAAVRAGGWTAIELWPAHWDVYVSRHGLAGARRALDASGLVAAGGCGAGAAFFVEPARRREALAQLERRLELCQALGAPHLVVSPGFTEPLEPSAAAFELAVENLQVAVAASKLHELWTVPDRELPLSGDRGGIPNARLLATIAALGYDGDVSLELFSAAFEARWHEDPQGASREAYRACVALTERAGCRAA
jgi:sugar phosphate isomerase/epimerase